jgi:CheY-like chemotaxis protein
MLMANLAHLTILKDQTILVVDDEPDSLEVVSILLEMYQATVITATNGREGLDAARKHRPVFIISDLSMPEMSGWEMLHELKLSRATLDIPVIALTAHAMEGDRNRAIAAGFHNYLVKPLMPQTFIHDLLNVVMDIPAIARLMEAVKTGDKHGSDA